jgi:glycosyltransferase involved in cell wall biosynthesis
MMRVLHVIPAVAPRYGGPSTAIVALGDALNRLPGLSAEVATTDADGPARFDAKRWTASRTPLHLFPLDMTGRTGRSSALTEWLAANVGRFDVIHTHSLWNHPVYAARRAAVRAGKLLVCRPCGMLSGYTWSRNRSLKYAYWLARERGNVAATAAFHCTSEDEANEVRGHRAARGAVRVIPNGVDAAAWTTPVDRNELLRRCGPAAAGKPILLFLSRLHPKKGLVDFLLPAFARMTTPAFLAVVGGPDDFARGHEAEVRDAVRRFGLDDRVALLGPADPCDRWALFDGADLFVLPSRSENFGIVVAEAMARGCPTVVSRGVQAGEHVTKAGAGAVVPLEVQPLATTLDDLLSDPEGRAAAGECGRAYARREFDWDRIAERVADLYRELHRGPA